MEQGATGGWARGLHVVRRRKGTRLGTGGWWTGVGDGGLEPVWGKEEGPHAVLSAARGVSMEGGRETGWAARGSGGS